MKKVKTYKNWQESSVGLTDYLQIGDLVDEQMEDYFLEVLPPACWNYSIIQIGEAQTHIQGKPTFLTLVRSSNGWMYAGRCFQGEVTEPNSER